MKKNLIIILIVILAAVLLATGFILLTDNDISRSIFTTTAPTYEPMDLFSEDVSKYITLGNYKGLNIETSILEYTREDVIADAEQLIYENGYSKKLEEGTLGEEQYFSFNYKGFINGVQFEGGTAENIDAIILEGELINIKTLSGFIPGFTEQILGGPIGEEFDIFVTFPEDYANTSYAGKDATFTIKINYVLDNTLTDETADKLSNGQFTNADEYVDFVLEYLNYEIKSNNTALAWAKIVEGATVIEIPEQEYNFFLYYYRDVIDQAINYYASMGQVYSYEQMMYMQYGFKSEAELEEYVRQVVKEELVVYAVMQAEGIELSEEEFNAYLEREAKYELTTPEKLLEDVGRDLLYDEFLINKTDEFIYSHTNYTLKTTTQN